LGDSQAQSDSGVAAHELDREADGAGQYEVLPEQAAGRVRSRPLAPENDEDQQIGRRLVDRRRVHAFGGRYDAVRIAHPPGQVGRHAIVAVAGELTADAADGLADGEARSGQVGDIGDRQAERTRLEHHRDRPADQSALPDPAAARQQQREGVALELVPGGDDQEEPRADEAANVGPEDEIVGRPRVVSLALQLAARDQERGQEAEEDGDPERVDGDAEEIEENGVHR
jgi:hypothetical protein